MVCQGALFIVRNEWILSFHIHYLLSENHSKLCHSCSRAPVLDSVLHSKFDTSHGCDSVHNTQQSNMLKYKITNETTLSQTDLNVMQVYLNHFSMPHITYFRNI